MKIIIIGLGNFGSAVAIKLAALGHEVIGVDSQIHRVENIKDKITYAVSLDCTDTQALKNLPLLECDIVLVAIGEDFGASILTTAILKKMNIKRLVSRTISPIHRTILEAIGVIEILSPEEDSAERFVKKIDMTNVLDYLDLSDDYGIVEAVIPQKYIGLSIRDADVRKRYNVNILTIKHDREVTNLVGSNVMKTKIIGVVSPDYVFEANDVIVAFGNMSDIKKWLH
ncbi:MAG: potassium transporter TrkA [Bacteroidetes bacterium GWA2_32_17]|nr:MAG: potassium transporter TrkA [Bacteroidetes bacterium GWA2_32_17]